MTTKTYTDCQKLSFKDIEALLISVSPKTAKQYLTDIKKEFDVKIVLFCHFKKYFKVTENT
jgi:pyruvate/oxaloacetate carboxyltransferase